jgi:hypothetical protein
VNASSCSGGHQGRTAWPAKCLQHPQRVPDAVLASVQQTADGYGTSFGPRQCSCGVCCVCVPPLARTGAGIDGLGALWPREIRSGCDGMGSFLTLTARRLHLPLPRTCPSPPSRLCCIAYPTPPDRLAVHDNSLSAPPEARTRLPLRSPLPRDVSSRCIHPPFAGIADQLVLRSSRGSSLAPPETQSILALLGRARVTRESFRRNISSPASTWQPPPSSPSTAATRSKATTAATTLLPTTALHTRHLLPSQPRAPAPRRPRSPRTRWAGTSSSSTTPP